MAKEGTKTFELAVDIAEDIYGYSCKGSLKEICNEAGVNPSYVSQHLVRMGVNFRRERNMRAAEGAIVLGSAKQEQAQEPAEKQRDTNRRMIPTANGIIHATITPDDQSDIAQAARVFTNIQNNLTWPQFCALCSFCYFWLLQERSFTTQMKSDFHVSLDEIAEYRVEWTRPRQRQR